MQGQESTHAALPPGKCAGLVPCLELAHKNGKQGFQALLIHDPVAGRWAARGGEIQALQGARSCGPLTLQNEQQQLHTCID